MTETNNNDTCTGDTERDYVRDCPSCGTRFVGMTPDEFRERHAEECNPVLGLLFFPEEKA